MNKRVQIQFGKIDNFKKLHLHSKDIIKVQKKIMELLRVKDLNELRDKYEGVAYYNKMSIKLLSLIALEDFLETRILDLNNILISDFDVTLNSIGLNISLIAFNANDLPDVFKKRAESTIFMLVKNPREIYLCGYIKKKELKKISNLRKNSSPLWPDKYSFIGFDKLITFESLEDLTRLEMTC